MLSTAQAAAALGIEPAGVRKLVQRRQLKATRFGNSLAFDPKDIERAKSRPSPGRPRRNSKQRA